MRSRGMGFYPVVGEVIQSVHRCLWIAKSYPQGVDKLWIVWIICERCVRLHSMEGITVCLATAMRGTDSGRPKTTI